MDALAALRTFALVVLGQGNEQEAERPEQHAQYQADQGVAFLRAENCRADGAADPDDAPIHGYWRPETMRVTMAARVSLGRFAAVSIFIARLSHRINDF